MSPETNSFSELPADLQAQIDAIFDPVDAELWVREPLTALGKRSFLEVYAGAAGPADAANFLASAAALEDSWRVVEPSEPLRSGPAAGEDVTSLICGTSTWGWVGAFSLHYAPPSMRIRLTQQYLFVGPNWWWFALLEVIGVLLGLGVTYYALVIAVGAPIGWLAAPRRTYTVRGSIAT